MPKSIPSLFLKEFYFFIMLLIFVLIGLFVISRRIKAGWLLFSAIFGTLVLDESIIYVTAYYQNTLYSIIYAFLVVVSLLGYIQSVMSFICKPIKREKIGQDKKKPKTTKASIAEQHLENKHSEILGNTTIPFKVEMGMSKDDKIHEKEMFEMLKSLTDKAKKDKKSKKTASSKNIKKK